MVGGQEVRMRSEDRKSGCGRRTGGQDEVRGQEVRLWSHVSFLCLSVNVDRQTGWDRPMAAYQ